MFIYEFWFLEYLIENWFFILFYYGGNKDLGKNILSFGIKKRFKVLVFLLFYFKIDIYIIVFKLK